MKIVEVGNLVGDVILIVRKENGQKMFHGYINRAGVRSASTSAISYELDLTRLEEISEVPLHEED